MNSKLHPLKLRRLEMGLSQYVLSFRTGIPQVKICYAEKGYPTLNVKQKEILARELGANTSELFPETKK